MLINKGGNTNFYYQHIKSNIQKVDKRTDKYIQLRKGFLATYCQPIQQKIDKLDAEIIHYRNLIENQNQMIEQQKEVTALKLKIAQFLKTQKYFIDRSQHYRQKIIQLSFETKFIEQETNKIKADINNIAKGRTKNVYEEFTKRNDGKSVTSVLSSSKISNSQDKLSLLPTIFKVQKYYVNKQTSKIKQRTFYNKNKKQINKSFTVDIQQKNKLFESKINQGPVQSVNLGKQLKKIQKHNSHEKLQQSLKIKCKQLISNFNTFEFLFKECFQKKKGQVQKSVSQLQSNLISNRQKFLQICESISQKDSQKFNLKQFENLTSDEIMTIFISFPWIQKKMFKQFVQKRKFIANIQQSKLI